MIAGFSKRVRISVSLITASLFLSPGFVTRIKVLERCKKKHRACCVDTVLKVLFRALAKSQELTQQKFLTLVVLIIRLFFDTVK